MKPISKEKLVTVVKDVLGGMSPIFALDGLDTRIAEEVATAVSRETCYTYVFLRLLLSKGYELSMECEGEPLTLYPTSDLEVLHTEAFSVDEYVMYIYDKDSSKCLNWILMTNCNDEDETICDYTCGDEVVDAIVEEMEALWDAS